MLEKVVQELLHTFKSREFQEKLQANLLEPILEYLLERLYPYLLAVSAIFFLTFVFVSLVLILVVRLLWLGGA
jgi:predicted PurR-regulated permease PerM